VERRKQLRFQPTATLEVVVIGEGQECVVGRVLDTSARGMGVQLPCPLPPGTAIKIEAEDTLLLGEVTCCVAQGGAFRVGLIVKHRLTGLGGLHRLNRALHAESAPISPQEEVSSGIMVE
jgi:hypothetical protein